jgi:trans-L-3-hydroxyproline dehydratase
MLTLRTIDAHTAGEPLRLIVGGFPPVEGETMLDKREWVREQHDHLRRALMLEPRGHADMYGALLTAPEHNDSDAGVLFMHNAGYSTMCGHGIIAVATIALERGLLMPRAGRSAMIFDTPAGSVHVTAVMSPAEPGRVSHVSFRNVPSFVLEGGIPVRLGSRELRADVAFGGAFYAIVDSESTGIPLVPERLADLRKAGMDIRERVEAALRVVHPEAPEVRGIYGTIFTGPAASPDADLRNVTVFADAAVDRSPCGTGTSAVMAVLSEMGLLGPGQTFTHESILGTLFRGRVVAETMVGEVRAVVPEIRGEAYITGESTFLIDERDPLAFGFSLQQGA